MRTTITIQDQLLERAKSEALRQKCTLGDIVNDALRCRLAETSNQSSDQLEEPSLKTYGAGGLRAGVDLNDNASINDAMDGIE